MQKKISKKKRIVKKINKFHHQIILFQIHKGNKNKNFNNNNKKQHSNILIKKTINHKYKTFIMIHLEWEIILTMK